MRCFALAAALCCCPAGTHRQDQLSCRRCNTNERHSSAAVVASALQQKGIVTKQPPLRELREGSAPCRSRWGSRRSETL